METESKGEAKCRSLIIISIDIFATSSAVTSSGFVKEVFAYLFISIFVIVPIILKLQKWISRYSSVNGDIELEADLYRSISSHGSVTIGLPESGALD